MNAGQRAVFDTIAVKHIFQEMPIKENLNMLGWKPCHKWKGSFCTKFINNEAKNSHKPRLTLSQSPIDVWHLRAEVTPSKWLYGSNTRLLDEADIKKVLVILSEYVSERVGFDFDAQTAQVARVDFAKDFQLREGLINSIITEISNVSLPHYNQHTINNTSIYFAPKGERKNKKFRLYDKFVEVRSKKGNIEEQNAARGIIRFEVAYMTTKAITQLQSDAKLSSRNAPEILTNETSDFALSEAMNLLKLESVLSKLDVQVDYIEQLLICYGVKRAMRLIGFVELFKKYGKDFYNKLSLGYTKRAYSRDLKDCQKAGVLI